MQSKLIAFLESQRRDAQLAAFLKPLVHVVRSEFGEDETRLLMVKAGANAAQNLILPMCESIGELELAANEHLSRLGWGVVSFVEQHSYLEISHECAPITSPMYEVFAGFLEGLYQEWFLSAGAGDQLQVRQQECAVDGIFLYRLF